MQHQAWVMVVWLLVGCPAPIAPDPAGPPTATGRTCPTVPSRIGPCNDFHLMGAGLTCGGDGTLQVAMSSTPGGGTRFVLQFLNGSRLQGSLVSGDPTCSVSNGTDADFTFGVVYTGDQGNESDGSACIVQSKLVFSNFNFDLVLMAPHEGRMKEALHNALDTAVINQIWGSPGSALPGRCARWRAFTICGDGLLDTGESCDDGNTTAGDGCNATCSGP